MRTLVPLLALAAAGCATLDRPSSGDWTMQASATAGSAVVWTEDGVEVLRLACRRNPADLLVTSARLGPAEPVRLRVGGATFPLTPQAGAPVLLAEGAIPETLPAALTSGGAIAVTSGRRRLGPYPALDPQTAAAFAIACRGPLG